MLFSKWHISSTCHRISRWKTPQLWHERLSWGNLCFIPKWLERPGHFLELPGRFSGNNTGSKKASDSLHGWAQWPPHIWGTCICSRQWCHLVPPASPCEPHLATLWCSSIQCTEETVKFVLLIFVSFTLCWAVRPMFFMRYTFYFLLFFVALLYGDPRRPWTPYFSLLLLPYTIPFRPYTC